MKEGEAHWSDCLKWERAVTEGILGSLWWGGQCGEHGLKLGGNYGESPGCEQEVPTHGRQRRN